jgi:uncharacterized RDD family membrane protein YckC
VSDAESPFPLASPGKRLGGALIDGSIFILLALATVPSDENMARGGIAIAWFLIGAVYEIGLTATKGQTLGKMLVRTQVLDRSGERLPAWNQSFVRWLVPAIPNMVAFVVTGFGVDALFFVWSLVVYVPILRSADRRGWHDRAAGTVVIDRALVTVD